jgi:hypothetical protein
LDVIPGVTKGTAIIGIAKMILACETTAWGWGEGDEDRGGLKRVEGIAKTKD